jgi:hypothetical protein
MTAINTKKLLPPPKTSKSTENKFLVPLSNIIPDSSSNVSGADIKPDGENEKPQRTSILYEVIRIRNKVIKIEELINKNNKIFQRIEENKRKLLERERFAKRERDLERNKSNKVKGLSIPSLPQLGFLDRLKQFLLFTTLGYVFNKFNKHIPKIIDILNNLKPLFSFFKDLTGNLLNGFVDFVGFGYKAYDQVKGIAKSIGGENFEKKFDEFSKQFNIFANLAIVAGLAATGGTDFGFGKSKGKPRINTKSPIAKSQYFNRDPQTKLIEKKYGNDAARMYEARKSQGVSVNRARADVLKRFKPITERYGVQRGLAGGTGKGAIFSRGVGKAANRASLKVLGKAGTKIAKGIFGRVPIIGGLLDFAFALAMGEKPGRAAAKAVGATIGSALGTFIPIPFAGTILGGILGDIVGGALYDTFAGNTGVQKKAQGGQVTRGGKKVGGSIRRKIKKIRRRPPRVQPQRTIPGKDIGGKKEIEKIFPSSPNSNTKNPLGLLETASKNLKEVPLIGGLMGASIDITMGQKPDKKVFQKIGDGFGALIQSAVDSQTSLTMDNVQKQIVGLAGGGVVPRSLKSEENIGMRIGEQITKTFETMVNSKVNETLQAIRKQINLESFGISTPDGGTVGGELDRGSLSGGNLTIEQLVGLAKGAGFSDNEAVVMAAIAMAESGGNSNEKNFKPPDRSYGLWQINMYDTLGPARMKEFGLSSESDLLDPVVNAYAAYRIRKSQGFSAWTVYKTGAYKNHLGAAQRASSAPKINVYKQQSTPGFASLGAGYGNLQAAQELASSMGLQMTSGKRGPRYPGDRSLHISGRAMDFSNVPQGTKGSAEMNKFAIEMINRYGSSIKQLIYTPLGYGIANGKQVPLSYWGNSINNTHWDHVHVAFEKGGKVHGLTRAMLGEKGPEFVLDADTTAALEQNFPGFLSALNKANYTDALSVLRTYASYENKGGSTIMIQRVIVEKPVPVPMSNSGYSSSSIDSKSNILEPLTVG